MWVWQPIALSGFGLALVEFVSTLEFTAGVPMPFLVTFAVALIAPILIGGGLAAALDRVRRTSKIRPLRRRRGLRSGLQLIFGLASAALAGLAVLAQAAAANLRPFDQVLVAEGLVALASVFTVVAWDRRFHPEPPRG